MSIQDVAKKVLKQYGGPKGPGFNLESLASSIARWTNFDYKDSLKVLEKARNSENCYLKTSENFIDE